MTTICYKDGHMAADTQMTINNYKTQTSKLYGIQGVGVLGLAGSGNITERVRRWWSEGRSGDAPTIGPEEGERGMACTGLLVTKEGLFYLEDGIYPHVIKAPYAAIGSGSDFAISAMSIGKSAAEAVLETMTHDIYTGGNVEVINCEALFEDDPIHSKKRAKKAKKKKND